MKPEKWMATSHTTGTDSFAYIRVCVYVWVCVEHKNGGRLESWMDECAHHMCVLLSHMHTVYGEHIWFGRANEWASEEGEKRMQSVRTCVLYVWNVTRSTTHCIQSQRTVRPSCFEASLEFSIDDYIYWQGESKTITIEASHQPKGTYTHSALTHTFATHRMENHKIEVKYWEWV